ncbi:MAG: hypothetical protein HGA53_08010 [Anaerolineaceae bacterium]|nr:hypothetical protein [Anaerolineaceae bacterium]
MKSEVGVWVDHRKAVIVTIEDEVEVIREIQSNMEKHVRFSSGTHSKDPENPQGSSAEDVRDRKFGDDLGRFYEGVVAFLRGADAIWIFGPGEAKGELEKRLKQEGLGDRIVGVDTVDKMTDAQIAAKTRDRYLR